MNKNYTDEEYANMAWEANQLGKVLYIKVEDDIESLVIAEQGYYVCYQDNYTNGTVNEHYEEERQQKERERISQLSLTRREVFLALYRSKGVTPEQLRTQIKDPEALIEFDYASEYFRGNPLINSVGLLLGYTPAELDYLFEHKSFPTHG